MKKVKVIKEMPFAKVGDIWDVKDRGLNHTTRTFTLTTVPYKDTPVEPMIRDGWLEWVEEPKSLEEIFKDYYNQEGGYPNYEDLAKIAYNHYKDIFDKAVSLGEMDTITSCVLKVLRMELFGDK